MTAHLGDQVLTPLNFLERAEAIHADRTAMTYHSRSWSYGEFAVTARRMAGTLAGHGVKPGDRVAVLASNTPLTLLAHYAVPLAGGVLVTLNHRLAAPELKYIVQHSGASLVLFESEFSAAAESFGIRTLAAGQVLDAPGPVGGAWLAADGEAVSTAELVRRIASALGVAPRVTNVPAPLLSLAARAVGRGELLRRTVASLEVDASPLVRRIGPPSFTLDRGLAATTAWWRLRHSI